MIHGNFSNSLELNMDFLAAVGTGDAALVKHLLADGKVDPASFNNNAIQVAAENGHLEVVKLLLEDKRVDPACFNNQPIRMAAENGRTEVVKLLLADKRIDPAGLYNHPIRVAAGNGHAEVVELLLADGRVNPIANDNDAIRQAAANGHFDAIISLLEHPAVLTYVRENLQDFITNNPTIQNALTSKHAQYNEVFSKAFFSIVSKQFMSTMPYHIAALHANGIPNDVIVNNIAPLLHPFFELYLKSVSNKEANEKVSADSIQLVNYSHKLLPMYLQASTAPGNKTEAAPETKSLERKTSAVVKRNRTKRNAFLDFGHWC